MPDIERFLGKVDRSGISEDSKALLRLFVDFFKEMCTENEEKVQGLNNEITALRQRVQSLEDKVDDASQYSRLDHIVVSPKNNEGLPVYKKEENSKKIVQDLFREHLSLEVADSDISIAHRIGRVKTDPKTKKPLEDRRSIIVRLCRKELIGPIFSHCKEKEPPFLVNEPLTPIRGKICYILRRIKKKLPKKVTKVRTFKGVPRAFHKPRGNTRATATKEVYSEISTMLQLEDFVKTVLQTTLLELSQDSEHGFTL